MADRKLTRWKAWRLIPDRETTVQFIRVAISGGASTIIYFAFLNLLRFGVGWSSFWSVTGAWIVATGSNYMLNRHWSFRLKSRGTATETGAFYVVSLGAWAATVGIVQLSEHLFGPLGPLGLNVTNIFADAVLIIPKFVVFRHLVFRRSLRMRETSFGSHEIDHGVERP